MRYGKQQGRPLLRSKLASTHDQSLSPRCHEDTFSTLPQTIPEEDGSWCWVCKRAFDMRIWRQASSWRLHRYASSFQPHLDVVDTRTDTQQRRNPVIRALARQAVDLSALGAQAAVSVERARAAAREQLAAALGQRPRLALRLELDGPKVAVPVPGTDTTGACMWHLINPKL